MHIPRPFIWHKSADEIFEILASYLPRITQNSTLLDHFAC